MTNDAPKRIWMDGDIEAGEGYWTRCFEDRKPCNEPALEYIRADIAQVELQAAVDAAYADAAWAADQMEEDAFELGEVDPLGEEYWPSCVGAAIRARANTDALAARDARVRAEALGEAAAVADNYILSPAAYGVYNSGESHAACEIERQILALIPADYEGEE